MHTRIRGPTGSQRPSTSTRLPSGSDPGPLACRVARGATAPRAERRKVRMRRIHTGVAVGLWAATAVASFAVGRVTAPSKVIPAPGDLAASIRAALAEGDALDRLGRTASLLQHLDAESLPEVLAVYDQMLPILGQWETRPFVAAWARFDPAGALQHVLAWPFRTTREIGVEAAIEGWALRDPVAARGAIEQLAADQRALQEPLLVGLLAGWVRSGPGGP